MAEGGKRQRIHVSSGLFYQALKGHFFQRGLVRLPSRSEWLLRGEGSGGEPGRTDGCRRRGERMQGVSAAAAAAGGASSHRVKPQAHRRGASGGNFQNKSLKIQSAANFVGKINK